MGDVKKAIAEELRTLTHDDLDLMTFDEQAEGIVSALRAAGYEVVKPEWEYGVHYSEDGHKWVTGTLERAQYLASPEHGDVIVKRRAGIVTRAGAWQPVEGE